MPTATPAPSTTCVAMHPHKSAHARTRAHTHQQTHACMRIKTFPQPAPAKVVLFSSHPLKNTQKELEWVKYSMKQLSNLGKLRTQASQHSSAYTPTGRLRLTRSCRHTPHSSRVSSELARANNSVCNRGGHKRQRRDYRLQR